MLPETIIFTVPLLKLFPLFRSFICFSWFIWSSTFTEMKFTFNKCCVWFKEEAIYRFLCSRCCWWLFHITILNLFSFADSVFFLRPNIYKKGLHLNSSTASNPLEVNISSGHSRIHRCRSSHKMLFWILYYLSESWFSSNTLIFNQHSPILEAFWIHDWRWSWQLLTFKERTFTQRKLRKYAGKKEKPRFHFQLEHQSREQKRKRIGTG